MIDHVTIRVPDLDEGRAFYDLARSLAGCEGKRHDGGGFVEWWDFSIAEATPERPVTARLHLGFFAESPAVADAWWEGMTAAGNPSDGEPGPR